MAVLCLKEMTNVVYVLVIIINIYLSLIHI